jgi:hypothetical protein
MTEFDKWSSGRVVVIHIYILLSLVVIPIIESCLQSVHHSALDLVPIMPFLDPTRLLSVQSHVVSGYVGESFRHHAPADDENGSFLLTPINGFSNYDYQVIEQRHFLFSC